MIDAAVAATCTTAGKTEGKHCSVCKEVLVAQTVVDALGHKYESVVTDPTCTTAGYTTHTCSVCKDSYTDSEVAALGHNALPAVEENRVEATYNSEGSYESVVYCSVCKTEVSRTTVTIPVLPDAVAQIGQTKYGTLQDAVEAAGEGATITLLMDLTIESDLNNAAKGIFNIAADDKITIDLNGKTIHVTDNSSGNFIVFYNYGDLTIKDGNVNLTATKNREWNAQSTIILNRGGKLTIESGCYIHNGGTDMAITVDNSANSFGDAFLVVNGGEIKSTYTAIRNRMANTTLNGTPGNGVAAIKVTGGTIYGGSRGIWGQITDAYADQLGSLEVVGGTIEGGKQAIKIDTDSYSNIGVTITGNAVIKGELRGEGEDFNITGGSFTYAVSEELFADNYGPHQNEDGSYGVHEHVPGEVVKENVTASGYDAVTYCSVCGAEVSREKVEVENASVYNESTQTYYNDLDDALDAADEANGGKIVLLADVEQKYLTVPANVTVDLNGMNVTVSYLASFGNLVDGSEGGNALVKVTKNIHLIETNTFLAVYDSASEGYRFYDYELKNLGARNSGENAIQFGIRLVLTNADGYAVIANTDDAKLKLTASITWTGSTAPIQYTFKGETVKEFAQAIQSKPASAILLTVAGINNLAADTEVTMVAQIQSETGMVTPIGPDQTKVWPN